MGCQNSKNQNILQPRSKNKKNSTSSSIYPSRYDFLDGIDYKKPQNNDITSQRRSSKFTAATLKIDGNSYKDPQSSFMSNKYISKNDQVLVALQKKQYGKQTSNIQFGRRNTSFQEYYRRSSSCMNNNQSNNQRRNSKQSNYTNNLNKEEEFSNNNHEDSVQSNTINLNSNIGKRRFSLKYSEYHINKQNEKLLQKIQEQNQMGGSLGVDKERKTKRRSGTKIYSNCDKRRIKLDEFNFLKTKLFQKRISLQEDNIQQQIDI